MNLAFDAVCWDHDGLLVDTEDLFYAATRDVFGEVGVLLTPQQWSIDYLSRGTGTASIAIALGISPSRVDRIVAERNGRYREMLTSSPPLLPGVMEALQALFAVVPMALVTGSPREEIEIVHRNSGILRFFSVAVTRDDYRAAKPAPDAYLEAARQLGVPPQRSLAVEDSERGLAAAVSAGMTCIVVPSRLTAGQRFEGAYSVNGSVASIVSAVCAPARAENVR